MLGIGVLFLLYLLYRTATAEIPEGLSVPDEVQPLDDSYRKKVGTWLDEAQSSQPEKEYAEGEVDPALQGIKLEPQTLHQGTRQEAEKPEILPEPLSAVLAAVEPPFRRTFNTYPSFELKFSFTVQHTNIPSATAEGKELATEKGYGRGRSGGGELGYSQAAGSVYFLKDSFENWHAKYDVHSESPVNPYNDDLYNSEVWYVEKHYYLKRPDKDAIEVTETSPKEDQDLVGKISSNSLDLLSHELLRRWVREAKFGVGYEKTGVDRWQQRPIDNYLVTPSHYPENPNLTIRTRQGTIALDREHNLPLRADLFWEGRTILPPDMNVFDSSQRVRLDILQIGTAPKVEAPRVKEK